MGFSISEDSQGMSSVISGYLMTLNTVCVCIYIYTHMYIYVYIYLFIEALSFEGHNHL